MKKILLLSAVLLGAVLTSQAGGIHVDVGIGLPFPRPGRVVVSHYPPPVYVQHAPVCAPAPVYYAPPPVCAQPTYYPPQPYYSGYSGSGHHYRHHSKNKHGGHHR